MERPLLQSALRELQVFLSAPRFWATFGAVVLIFWVTGPYGTGERLATVPRLGFWLVLHAVAWGIAVVAIVAVNTLFRRKVPGLLPRMALGTVVASVPVGLATEAISLMTFGGTLTPERIAESIATGLLLSALFCALSFMTMSSKQTEALAAASPPATAPEDRTEIPLMRRLKPESRGPILHMTVADHYTQVTTSRGRELILLRFSDALAECGDTPGLKVHRSHFVADAHVDRLLRTEGRLAILLRDGQEIPVSRSCAEAVRARWG
ncbi:LytTR family transcriptional regulator DNA-binding domain-containing protein [Shinella sp. 838]|uniref:LytTR family DNA-binding domain-containing protein n=1 Tax=unclassified Shinella TaxID=2643062 RepID=UPI0003C5597C|nr:MULTISPECIES: LytTR family DNA-binding domain-containing protein [unclassified Shinella]EYR79063.1 response regulator of the LytR/AlgR family [Shinella sp. DD12]MCA0343015.1 LytTR family transcriptional regulator [Pseudomonadota bacterium]MDG4670189.1 LytTR family transcriptional regulator DNA-binding domain-containing protein [Shinella sp. 838]